MKAIVSKLKHEIIAVIPPTIFFFVAFQLISFTRALMLEEYGISVYSFVNASIAALIIAKVILFTDMLPLVNRFPEKPLIYNVVWKTVIYMIAAFIVRYVEHLIPFIREYGDIVVASRHLHNEVTWPYFWAVQIWLLVTILVYCAIRELIRALGRERITAMFFHTPVRLAD